MTVPVRIIKIDPEKRLIAPMAIHPSVRGVRKLIGAAKIGHRIILQGVPGVTDEHLIVASRLDVDRVKPLKEWRFRGTDNTVGVGLLFGTYNRNQGGPGMWNCPVDLAWVIREIVWCEPGEDAPAAEVAERLGLEAPGGSDGAEKDA